MLNMGKGCKSGWKDPDSRCTTESRLALKNHLKRNETKHLVGRDRQET